jgi:hypothetical protein
MPPTAPRVSKLALRALRAAFHSTLLAATLASMVLLPLPASAMPAKVRWPAYFEVLGKFTNSRQIGQGRLFVPLWQDPNDLVFLDLRGLGDSKSNTEGNFGAAYRHLFDSWLLGGYGFFDVRNSDLGDNSFIGGVLGTEALSANWDFRINGYIPDQTSKSASRFDSTRVVFPNIVIDKGRERSLWGTDGEIGWRLPFSADSALWDTRIYAGGYYFGRSGVETVAGPRGRFEMRLHDLPDFLPRGSRITLDGLVQWDDPRGTVGGGGITLRIPLYGYGGTPPDGSTAESRLSRRMTDPIQRDVDLLTGIAPGAEVPAYNPKTGNELQGLYYADSQNLEGEEGIGTLDDPANIDDAIAWAGIDGVIVAVDRTGTIDTWADAPEEGRAQLLDGQILMGGGESIVVADESGRLLPFNPGGSRASLTNTDPEFTQVIVYTGRNNLIDGLDFFGGYTAIESLDPGSVPGGDGPFDLGGGLMVMDSTFTDHGRYGIHAGFDSDPSPTGGWLAGIMNNSFSGDFRAIKMLVDSTFVGVDISGNSFSGEGSSDDAIRLRTESEPQGFRFADVNISGNSFDGYFRGIRIDSNSDFFRVDDLDLEIAGNRFDAGEEPFSDGQALRVLVDAVDDVHASIHDNVATGFPGRVPPVFLVDVFDSDIAWVSATNNRITAPEQGGGRAMGISAHGDFSATLEVSDNVIDGYRGIIGDGVDPAVEVYGSSASSVGGVDIEVARNRVTGPEATPLDMTPEAETGPGYYGVLVGAEQFGIIGAEQEDGVELEPAIDVRVFDNRIANYTGGFVFDDIAALRVDTFAGQGSLSRVAVTNNTITAPEDPEIGQPFGVVGLDVNVSSFASDVNVANNVVTGYAGQSVENIFDARAPEGIDLAAAVDVAVQGSYAGVAVTGNRITAPTFEEQTDFTGPGLDVSVFAVTGLPDESEGDGEPSSPADVIVSNNSVRGFTGLPELGYVRGFAAVEVLTQGDLSVAVTGNEIGAPQSLAEGFPTGSGLLVESLGAPGYDFGGVDVTVADNVVERYAQLGYLFDPRAAASGEKSDENGIVPGSPAVAVYASAEGEDVDVDVSHNRISTDGSPGGTGLFVGANSFGGTATANVDENTVEGYIGATLSQPGVTNAIGPSGAAVLVSAYGTDVDIDVTGNEVSAPVIPDFFGEQGESLQFGFNGILVGAAAGSVEDGGDSIDVNVANNEVQGYAGFSQQGPEGAGVGIVAYGAETIDINASGNHIDGIDLPVAPAGTGLSVTAQGFGDATITVSDNELLDYLGYLGYFAPVGAALEVEAFGESSATISVTNNRVSAPVSRESGQEIGGAGIFVEGDVGDSLDVNIVDNGVFGYSGSAGSEIPAVVGAIDVSADVDNTGGSLGVIVDGNEVTSPPTGPEAEFELTGPGIHVSTETSDENLSRTDVFVTGNEVTGYTGAPFGGPAAVQVDSFGNFVNVTVGGTELGPNANFVVAPSQGGFTGIGVYVNAFVGNVTVEGNQVSGYSQAVVPAAQAEGEKTPEVSSTSPAIRVSSFVFGENGESTVRVLDNQVTAPSQGGATGVFVNTSGAIGSTTLEGNSVSGYSNGLNVQAGHGDASVSVTGNSVQGENSTQDGLFLAVSGQDTLDVTVEDNQIGGSGDDGMDVRVVGLPALESSVDVVGNAVSDSGGDGIAVTNFTTGEVDATIGGNSVQDSGEIGIDLVQSGAAPGELAVSSEVDGTVENNAVSNSGTADLATSGNVTGTIRVNGVDESLPLP